MGKSSHQISTISFFKFDSFEDRVWAFKMMNEAHSSLIAVEGQVFYKLMGSGAGLGFNLQPDWSVYSLLQVWQDAEMAVDFFEEHELHSNYASHAAEYWTLWMKNITAKGSWSGQAPFQRNHLLDPSNRYTASLTRGSIKSKHLLRFWSSVSHTQRSLSRSPGLLFTKGIAEVPLVRIATFSLWKNETAMTAFAYGSEHQRAIADTRKYNWFSEELFARFQPFHATGTWRGEPVLPFEA